MTALAVSHRFVWAMGYQASIESKHRSRISYAICKSNESDSVEVKDSPPSRQRLANIF